MDTSLQDGTSCNSNTAFCYDGVCQTHDDQCRFHFGMNGYLLCVTYLLIVLSELDISFLILFCAATSKGLDACSSTFNTRGDQFRSYGTTCRAASGQCDIEEYCSGDSSECPVDTGLQDGTSCNSNTAFCYDGVCQTHDDQCRFHFGMNGYLLCVTYLLIVLSELDISFLILFCAATSKGLDACFSTFNTRGDQFGNCGHTASGFIPCSTRCAKDVCTCKRV